MNIECTNDDFPKDWALGKIVGKGGYGAVNLLIDKKSEEETKFVVKTVIIEKASLNREQEINELNILKQTKHERIVTLCHYEEKEEQLLLFFKYMPLGSLEMKINNEEDLLPVKTVLKFTWQILDGLRYLHVHEPPIIHRDIKCANILLESPESVQLADFGVSKVLHSYTNAKSQVGSYYWMAPEVIKAEGGSFYTVKADIWSMGCTVVEMVTKHPPFRGINGNFTGLQAAFKIGNDVPPAYNFPHVANHLHTFVQEMFEKDPLKRPTAEELSNSNVFKDV